MEATRGVGHLVAPKATVLDRDEVFKTAHEVAATEKHPSRAKVASRLGLIDGTFNQVARRNGWVDELDSILTRKPTVDEEPEGVVHYDNGSADLISPATEDVPWTRDGLLKHFKFEPEGWEVTNAKVNAWGTVEAPWFQLKLSVVPVGGIVRPADPTKWTPPKKPKTRISKTKPVKYLLCSDLHAPRQEQKLCDALCYWLEDEKPDRAIMAGDILDAETISRHRPRERPAALNDGIQSGHNQLRDFRSASTDTEWWAMEGNHDVRFRTYLIDNAPNAYGIKAANDDVPAYHLRRLLLLDELGIKWWDEDWDVAHFILSEHLSITHRAAGGKNAANQALDRYDESVAQGDSHRLQMVWRTKFHNVPDGGVKTSTRLAAQIGCLCEIKEGLDYAKRPDWQQGAMVAHVYPDGQFSMAPLIYVKDTLLAPSGKRYSA